MIREFRLSSPGKGGVSCDADGAFVGAIPILNRLQKDGKDAWHPRDSEELSEEIGEHCGLPVDMSSKTNGLKAIAKALNEGNVARAQIATVLLGIPDLPPLSKKARSRDQMIKLIRDLDWSGMLKWDADEHPRWPAGSDDSKGGKFAPKGEGDETSAPLASLLDAVDRTSSYDTNQPRDESRSWAIDGDGSAQPDTTGRSARIQLADVDTARSDAANDPVAEAVARAAAAARQNSGTAHSHAKPVDGEYEDFWQTLGSRLSHEAKSILSRIGRAEIAESDANVAMGTDEANAISHTLKAYADYRAQPWLHPDGRPVQVPVEMSRELFEPNAPLTRPATNADWIDPLINLASFGAMSVGPALRLVGPVAEAIDSADVATLSADAAGYRATFGKALTSDYRATFFESNPELENQVVVHHAVPQRTLTLYPDEVTESEIHSLENLRGIPNELNSDVHLSQIAKEWNQFYKANPSTTQAQLLQKATKIDLKYGGQFRPPVGGGR